MEKDEAVASLLDRMPRPEDDLTELTGTWEARKDRLAQRAPYSLPTPKLEPLPQELVERGEAFKRRPDVQASLHGLDWDVGIVDLTRILTFQKLVVLEQIAERVAGVSQDHWGPLFSLCLPDSSILEVGGMLHPSGRSITLSSPSPNLRVSQHILQDLTVAPAPGVPGQTMKFFGFAVSYGAPFLQVAEYKGRWFVRDGYHRSYGLLSRGVARVPAVFVKARSFTETGAAAPIFLSREILFGDHPPTLKDFFDDDLAMTVSQRVTRKIVRITAEEFVVEV
jgi:hypothetical protein